MRSHPRCPWADASKRFVKYDSVIKQYRKFVVCLWNDIVDSDLECGQRVGKDVSFDGSYDYAAM